VETHHSKLCLSSKHQSQKRLAAKNALVVLEKCLQCVSCSISHRQIAAIAASCARLVLLLKVNLDGRLRTHELNVINGQVFESGTTVPLGEAGRVGVKSLVIQLGIGELDALDVATEDIAILLWHVALGAVRSPSLEQDVIELTVSIGQTTWLARPSCGHRLTMVLVSDGQAEGVSDIDGERQVEELAVFLFVGAHLVDALGEETLRTVYGCTSKLAVIMTTQSVTRRYLLIP